ncbi:MAG TPA: dethiobiotin synthase [Pirellulaceae bacterium]|nr:dethiobiotin synthase [Pirellulaceae bacterium]
MAVPGLFITGTDTNVGKTYVTALIAKQLIATGKRVGVYKPAASGCVGDESDDPFVLWQAAGRPATMADVCPQRFTAPLAPHLAARAEGKEVDVERLRAGLDFWRQHSDVILVEGLGGLMSPVSDDEYVADLAHDFRFPLIIVAPNALGVINQTLQTLITASTFRDGLDVAGIVLNHRPAARGANDVSTHSNVSELAARCIAPILATVDTEFDRTVDWMELARREPAR